MSSTIYFFFSWICQNLRNSFLFQEKYNGETVLHTYIQKHKRYSAIFSKGLSCYVVSIVLFFSVIRASTFPTMFIPNTRSQHQEKVYQGTLLKQPRTISTPPLGSEQTHRWTCGIRVSMCAIPRACQYSYQCTYSHVNRQSSVAVRPCFQPYPLVHALPKSVAKLDCAPYLLFRSFNATLLHLTEWSA